LLDSITAVQLARASLLRGGAGGDLMSKRKRLLPVASAGGSYSDFSIKDKDWPAVERAYGYEFSRGERAKIQEATRGFIYLASLEASAEPVSAAQGCVLAWKRAASKFDRALYGQAEGDARAHAKHLVAKYFGDRRFRRADLFQDLSAVLSDFIAACSHALKEYDAHDDGTDRGFRQGEWWDHWVRDLTRVLTERGYPTTVRSDDLGFKSHFTRLVQSLQKLVPTKVRRVCSSDEAMGKAIERARKPRDK
jgi:hypothetical protein